MFLIGKWSSWSLRPAIGEGQRTTTGGRERGTSRVRCESCDEMTMGAPTSDVVAFRDVSEGVGRRGGTVTRPLSSCKPVSVASAKQHIGSGVPTPRVYLAHGISFPRVDLVHG